MHMCAENLNYSEKKSIVLASFERGFACTPEWNSKNSGGGARIRSEAMLASLLF